MATRPSPPEDEDWPPDIGPKKHRFRQSLTEFLAQLAAWNRRMFWRSSEIHDQGFGPKEHRFGQTPTPPWVWLLVIGLPALIFWQFVPKTEVQVLYYPWFMEQVQNDNLRSISFQGIEIRGELREVRPYAAPSGKSRLVRRFLTYAPSEALIKPVVEQLQGHAARDQTKGIEPLRIEGNPPDTANGIAWIMLLLPTFLILGFIDLMMRRARGG